MNQHDNHFVEAEELHAWLDSELEPARQRAVAAHVAECYECAALAEDLKRVSSTLQQWNVEDAPASLRPPVLEGFQPRFSLLRLRPIFALAGAAAVILIIAAVSIPNLLRSKMEVSKEVSKTVETARTREQEEDLGFFGGEKDDQAVPAPGDSPKAQTPPPATIPGKKPRQEIAKLKNEDGFADRVASGLDGAVAGGAPGDALENQVASRQSPAMTATSAASVPDAKELRKLAVAEEMAEPVNTLAANQPSEADATLRDSVEASGRREGESKAFAEAGAGALAPQQFARRKALQEAADLERRLLAYQVNMGIEVDDFDAARRKVESLVTKAGGYPQDSRTSLQPNQKQQASFHLRVPTDNLQDVLKEFRTLGKVVRENMTTEELTDQLVDIDARQRNSRNTEARLLTLQKTAKLDMKQSLAVEREISRVRSEIERREAQRLALLGRAAMASIHLELLEEFKAEVEGASMGFFRQIRNAAVEGFNGFMGMLLAFATFFARWGLHLIFWVFLGKLLWRFWLQGFARTFQLNQL